MDGGLGLCLSQNLCLSHGRRYSDFYPMSWVRFPHLKHTLRKEPESKSFILEVILGSTSWEWEITQEGEEP